METPPAKSNSSRLITAATLVVIAVECALRVAALRDMEFKADERVNVGFLAALGARPWTALAPVSEHAGFCHSSGFYYLVRFLSFGSNDPLVMGRAIAWCNAALLALALWIARKLPSLWTALVICATSVSLVVYSRKIWQPDLIPAWTILSLALIARALATEEARARRWFLVGGAVALVAGGHMYLAAGPATATVGLVMLIHHLKRRAWRDAAWWTAGCTAAALTYVPYLLSVAHGEHRASAAAAHLELAQLPPILQAAAGGPAPYSFYKLYIEPVWPWLTQHRPDWSLWTFYGFLWLSIALGIALFWIALLRIARRWREAARDPLLIAALSMTIVNSLALFLIRLGSYPHYWLALFPFSAYLVARAARLGPDSRAAAAMRGTIVVFCAVSTIAAAAFLIAVHARGGLPGEYGRAYAAQLHR